MNEKISVIVPVYKVEEYLDKCVESIVNQTYKNLEIILVDDGSPDNCPKMCDEWAKKDERIRVIHKQNGGLSDARNAGIDVATGEFMAFVDSDDYIALDMYEKLYTVLKNNDADVSICSFKSVDENGKEIDKYKDIKYVENEILDNEQAVNKLFESKNMAFVIAWNKLYKKDIFNNIYFAKGRIHEDEFAAHHILNASKKIACITDKLYLYCRRDVSIMGSKRNIRHLDVGLAMIDRYYFLKEKYPYLTKKQAQKVYAQALIALKTQGYSNLPSDYKDMVKTAFKLMWAEKDFHIFKLLLNFITYH